MWRPLFTHQPGQTLTSHSYNIPQQKSAAFLLNSLVLPFCTWGLPEWWSTEVFVLEAGALAAYTIKVFWKSLCLNCLVVCFLSSSLLLRWLSGSGLTSIADTCVVSSSPHPLFLFDLFMKVSLLTSCTVLIKGFYWLKNHYEPMNPALIYQSTAEMSVWHKMQSVSSAGFNCFGFFFIFWSSILNWWSAQSPNAAAIFFYITDFSKLSFTASGRCATWNILSGLRAECQIMMSTNGLQDRGRKTEGEREINGLQENVSEAERGKKDVYICSSMQSAHVCVCEPSVMYSRQQWWMWPFFHTPVLSLQVYQQFCCRQPREGLFHCSLLWLFWKWVALRINLLWRQHKYFLKRKI